jgi:opacity protein-like surface antigen
VQVAALVLELAARAAPASADEPPRTDEAPRSDDASRDRPANEAPKPPPLHVEYAQYGVAFAVESALSPGATCPPDTPTVKAKPCILGSGGGLAMRAGYRNPGSFYVGGAYEFTKMDSQNLYRLGIFQQLRAEARYIFDLGYRASPYLQAGIGAVAYGNEWGIETGGGQLFAGLGVEAEVSRLAVLGLGVVYRPTLIAAWKDTAGQERPLGVAQFFGIDLILEVRTVLGRR